MDQAMLPGMENTLPLLSGTPMQVTRKGLQPAAELPAQGQQSFASCSLCRDTGRLRDADRLHYCWCAAGVAAREENREKGTSICEVTLSTVRENSAGVVCTQDNWVPENDKWGDWEKAVRLGRGYLVGSRVPMGALPSRSMRQSAPDTYVCGSAPRHPRRSCAASTCTCSAHSGSTARLTFSCGSSWWS
jgi:hypothetical protein